MKVLCIGINKYIRKNIMQFNEGNVQYTFFEENDICGIKFINNLEKFKNYSVMLIGIDCLYDVKYSFEVSNEILTKLIYIISNIENVNRIIFLSSYGVYKEKVDESLYNEEDKIEPHDYKSSLYYYYESMLRCACEESAKELVIIRLFNTFGLYQNEDFIITYLVNEMLKNTKEIFVGDTRKKRDYIYIRELVNLLNILINKKLKQIYNVYNFGMGNSYSIKETINMIGRITGKDKSIVFNPNKIRASSDYNDVKADISKIKNELQFEFQYTIEEALKNYIELFKIDKER